MRSVLIATCTYSSIFNTKPFTIKHFLYCTVIVTQVQTNDLLHKWKVVRNLGLSTKNLKYKSIKLSVFFVESLEKNRTFVVDNDKALVINRDAFNFLLRLLFCRQIEIYLRNRITSTSVDECHSSSIIVNGVYSVPSSTTRYKGLIADVILSSFRSTF